MKQLLKIFSVIAVVLLTAETGKAQNQETELEEGKKYLVIRADDFGMTHGANMALKELIATGLPISASVMPPTPWFLEAADILKKHPEVSVGVHLTLNAEWNNYRWGAVAGKGSVPTLVDEMGYFFPSSDDLYNNNPDLGELETELRAQIDRVLAAGLDPDYVDFHMGTAAIDPDFRQITEKVAEDYGLKMSGFLGETMTFPQYAEEPDKKLDRLVEMLNELEPGVTTVIVHIGLDTPEMAALVDMNENNPLPEMSRHRNAELRAFTSQEFLNAVESAGVDLITYRDLIKKLSR